MFEDRNPVYPKICKPSPAILRVWENDFGVPSVDPECLQLITLFKVHRINVVVQHAYCPQWLDIPSIQYNNAVVTGSDLILQAVNLCKATTDTTLEIGIRSRIAAYKKYFMESFADAFYFDCWLNDVNYENTIKTWYTNVIPFPFNYFYLKRMRTLARERFKSLLGPRDPDKFMIRQLSTATRCLEDFAGLLRDGRCYFFGELPSSLDITIYSYLAVALNIPLPDPQLQNLIKSHPALIRFVKNMTQKYFPSTPVCFKYIEPINTNADRASTKSLVIAGMCATMAMLLYACSIGLVSKPEVRSIDHMRNKIF